MWGEGAVRAYVQVAFSVFSFLSYVHIDAFVRAH